MSAIHHSSRKINQATSRPRITHYGTVHIGNNITYDCAVLEDGRRGYTYKTLRSAIGLRTNIPIPAFERFCTEIAPNAMKYINKGAVVDYLIRWSIMDGITHCKLKKNTQRRLLEFFILEVTARSAANFLEIQPNTAILFYKKIRQVIAHHLALESTEMFDGKIELDESYFGGHRKGKRGRGAADKVAVFGILKKRRKSLYSGC